MVLKCVQLRAHNVYSSKDVELKLEHVTAYKMHLEDVQRDRALEHAFQSENVLANTSGAILFIQTDGMDQGKWALPRFGDRVSKQAAKIVRFLAAFDFQFLNVPH